MASALPWTYDRRRPKVRKPPTGRQLMMNICVSCGVLTTKKRTCSSDCFKDEMRNRYRVRVGIPLDAPLYPPKATIPRYVVA